MSYLNFGIESAQYFFSNYNGFLEADNYKLTGANIGEQGDNLTISFLSLNRVELSIRLLSSINEHLKEFKGEVLIIDNGSNPEQISKLKSFCSNQLTSIKYKIIELGSNYGVAGGRNRTIQYLKTDWVMFLDNDIYFINNPIKRIHQDLSLTGAHFINLPLLDSDETNIFALGGHLYIDSNNGEISVGGGSCYKQIEYANVKENESPFLSNFLFGGSSVLKKQTFEQLGCFDENMFIGFEDTDFSIRLFQAGQRIANTKVISLVHDHPKPEKQADLDYEKQRYSSDIIKNSALYLEQKYGIKIWGNYLINWLEEKNHSLGNEINIKIQLVSGPEENRKKKIKIGLITDVDNWAFGNISRQIYKNLQEDFEFVEVSFKDYKDNPIKLLFRTYDCDILHFFWREMIPFFDYNEEYYKSYAGDILTSYKEFFDTYFGSKVLSTCVYDHLFLEEEDIKKRFSIFNKFNYYVSSNKLFNIYNDIDNYKKPHMVIEDGVDLNFFYPSDIERIGKKRKLTVGWVGNSKWASESIDYKGFHTIIKPAIEALQSTGYEIEGHYCDRNEGFVEHRDMVKYYAKIDVLLCASLIEGTPNPVLEAMACGIPVISTDVGIVPQVFGENQMNYILKERTIEALQKSILELYENREQLKVLSKENIGQIKHWSWYNQTRKFKQYFNDILKESKELKLNEYMDSDK